MAQSVSIRAKILFMCIVLAVFAVVVGGIGLYSSRQTIEKYNHVAALNLPKTKILGDVMFHFRQVRIELRSLGIAGLSREQIKGLQEKTLAAASRVEASANEYKKLIASEDERVLFDRAFAEWKTFASKAPMLFEWSKIDTVENRQNLTNFFLNDCLFLSKNFEDALGELKDFQTKDASAWVNDAVESAGIANSVTLAVVVTAFVLALVVGFVFSGSLSKALSGVSARIRQGAESVAAAATQFSASGTALSQSTTEAASSVEETVSSLEELSSMVKLNADNAKEAASVAQVSAKSAQEGEEEIKKLIVSMQGISDASKKIEDIINVIDDIAFQTNLLALNAAVEAARAGEQGKGFAVVAEAVRSLAQRSADAAKDITNLIQESVRRVEGGAQIADASGNVLKRIVASAQKVCDLNNEIASASAEQATGIGQISKAMNELDSATQRNAASAEEVASSSDKMSSQAELLRNLVTDLNVVITGGALHKPVISEAPIVKHVNVPKVTDISRARVAKKATAKAEQMIPFDETETKKTTVAKIGTTDGF